MHMSMGRDHFWKTDEDLKKILITEIKFNNPVHDAHTLTGKCAYTQCVYYNSFFHL